eukprot:GHVS01058221.1.p1 GENE.GHVS01058221.1~~GHVS01058221.1.p1  ORF type:complete len:496 (-),score=53.03 GHVS01058221.1:1014-2501(-)
MEDMTKSKKAGEESSESGFPGDRDERSCEGDDSDGDSSRTSFDHHSIFSYTSNCYRSGSSSSGTSRVRCTDENSSSYSESCRDDGSVYSNDDRNETSSMSDNSGSSHRYSSNSSPSIGKAPSYRPYSTALHPTSRRSLKSSSFSPHLFRGAVHGLLYSKFDLLQGPKVVCSAPQGILEGGEMQFRSISKYFFMHSDLNSKIIALRLGEWRIMGVPVKLEDAELYSRNSFQFTFCLVIDTASDETPFRDMAIQFACAFTQLEKRSRFLSTASNEHLLANCLIDMLEQLKHSDIIRICLPDSQEICLTFHNPEARQTIARPLAATTTVDRPKSNRSFTCTTPSNNTTVQARLASLATSSPDHPPSAPDRTSPFCSFRPRRDGPVYVQPWQVPLPLVEFRELLAQTRRYLGLMGGLRWARRRRKPTKNTPGWGEPSKGAKEQIREETGSGSSSDPYPVYLDATLLQVLAFIDGIRTVRAIAVDSEVDESFVVACLEHL